MALKDYFPKPVTWLTRWRQAKKTKLEIQKLQRDLDDHRPIIQKATLQDVHRYDPKIATLDDYDGDVLFVQQVCTCKDFETVEGELVRT